ncbi:MULTISPECIES: S1 domain-containing post-transcriptional regulator GSP13 [Salimicrobium]|uniref:General stress protein 13 n=4 Tax=Salimicrobium TaxID=351195 RepID=K2GDM4_9BACI|nr:MULTISPECIES: S1 domain-containing post-transcriptional regulator GSP13 [Salimicrobium]AKG04032.1 RNA-binding protein S1 [Salimicrobium jeotgali]EKE33078.1 general stress protein 13 [Salimicrobium jeotgali]MBM7694927.1 general stress protein 13 [Salimicrobium jeotgali]PBB06329.1 RNA-binding protein S1 [Salimicrobium humidisoli]SDY02504.1 general stress protein 13 [Salimicrobium album]
MAENFQEGQVVEGKVTGIQPYGAFVALDDKVQGLVHISEVTHGFVKDVNEHLSEGDEVQVKILNIDEAKNKYSLSIRATQEAPKRAPKQNNRQQASSAPKEDQSGFNTLKDKLEDWIKQSDDREKYRN